MNTKALRQKILDLAIRGKLVPQDPNDEPAEVLLERIRKQKQQMLKEGKLKKKDIKNDTIIFKGEDNLHYEKFQDGTVKCIEDEIPFEVPEGWAWTRISTVAIFIGGYAYKSSKYIPDSQNILIRIGNIKNNNITPLIAKTCISDEYAAETGNYLIRENDILFTMTGTRGKRDYFYSCRIEKSDLEDLQLFLNQRVGCLRLISTVDILPSYFVNTIQSSYALDAIFATETGNVNQGNIGSTATLNLLIPVAPTEEQYKIQEKSLALLSAIEQHDIDTEDLSKIINKLRIKILDLAIRGKLVPQDPNDEPASVLLERIRAEKEELIKQGKIKRDKKESIIFKGEDNSYYLRTELETMEIADELPYEIPESWEWARIGNVFQVNPRNKLDDLLEVSFIPMPLIDDGFSGKHTSEVRVWEKIKSGFTHFTEGDIGIAKITPCFENRKSVVFRNLKNNYGAGTTELHVLRPYASSILPEYVLAYVKSSMFIDKGKQEFTGAVGQQRIGKDYVENSYFPIPPLAEQKRIVEQISTVYKQLDLISNALR